MMARIEMNLKDSAREDEDKPSSKNWKLITLEELYHFKEDLILPDPQRYLTRVPILGPFGITGYHEEIQSKGPGVTIGQSGSYGRLHQ